MSITKSKYGRRFDEEFKREVADLASKPGAKQEQVARDLGVSPYSVARWKKQYAAIPPMASPGVEAKRRDRATFLERGRRLLPRQRGAGWHKRADQRLGGPRGGRTACQKTARSGEDRPMVADEFLLLRAVVGVPSVADVGPRGLGATPVTLGKTPRHRADHLPEDTGFGRSLCHAWSAHPVIEYIEGALGLQIEAPGWIEVTLRPAPLPGSKLDFQLCSPHGELQGSFAEQAGKLDFNISKPAEIALRIRWGTAMTILEKGKRRGDGRLQGPQQVRRASRA